VPTKRQFGNIRKLKSGRFQARYTAPDGEPVKAPRTFETARDADRWLTLEHARLLSGTWHDPNAGRVLLRDYAEHWLDAHLNLKPKTRRLYADLIGRFVAEPRDRSMQRTVCPDLGEFRLKDITPGHVERWLRWVREVSEVAAIERGTASPGSPSWNRALRSWAVSRGLNVARTGRIPERIHKSWRDAGSPDLGANRVSAEPGRAQAANAYRLLSAVMNSAVQAGLIGSNPCRVKGAGRSRTSTTPPASLDELVEIADAMPDRYRVLIPLTAFGALRAGEALGLARRHVDLDRRTVTIERSINYLPGQGQMFGPPKSEAGRRTIHLPREVVELLRHHLTEYVGPASDSLLFTTSNGAPLHSSNRTVMFRRAAAAAGRPDLRFHDLRHTGATLAAQQSATLPELMKRLGHASARASLIYLHATDQGDRQLSERMSPTHLRTLSG